MNFFQHRYYRTTKSLMTIIGQWPYQTARASCPYIAVIIILSIGQIAPMIMAVVKYHDNRSVLLDGLLGLFYGAWCVIKLLTFMCNSEKMLKMVNRIQVDWLVWSNDREVEILHEYAEQGRKFTIVYTVTMYWIGFVYLTQPIVPKIVDVLIGNGTKIGKFPIPVYYHHIDEEKYYFYLVIWECLCISMALTLTITYDVVLIVYVQHGCAVFAAIGHKLERIGKNVTLEETGEIAYDSEQRRKRTFEELIISCIVRHNDAIEYAKLIDTTYTWSFFVTVVLRIAIISMTGLQIVTRTNEPEEAAKIIAFAIGIMMYVYMESHIAQVLMDHSASIHYYIQNSHWYSLSLKEQKLLHFMTMRCNAPCQLTAGKMLNMSVESFAVFLKTAMSYLTVLRSM